MPSWRPATATDPDGEGSGYVELEAVAPALRQRLVDRYATGWLGPAGLDLSRYPEVVDTVELSIHADHRTLRFRSWYTGTTYWGPAWNGELDGADEWIDAVAALQVGNVGRDRQLYDGTPWDRAPGHM